MKRLIDAIQRYDEWINRIVEKLDKWLDQFTETSVENDND